MPEQFVSFADRICCVVLKPHLENPRQPFYRSTGRNSKQEGTWFPFNGVHLQLQWFVKLGPMDRNDPLHRFGTFQNIEISKQLAEIELPENIRVIENTDGPGMKELNHWLKEIAEPVMVFNI